MITESTLTYCLLMLSLINSFCFAQETEKPILCGTAECVNGPDGPKAVKRPGQETQNTRELQFCLRDTMGMEIRSEDYSGTPVLIMCGSCWCGGCQQDAEELRKIAEQYMPRGLAVIRSVSCDNELAARDFAKHYRLNFPQIMDTNREFEKRYNDDGWTFLMLADGDGRVIYKCNSPVDEHWPKIRQLADKMLKEKAANGKAVIEGAEYSVVTIERSGETKKTAQRDELTSIACADNGRTYVVFTSNRNGNNDIFFRLYDGSKWSEDKPLTDTKADEYDGTIIVDSNNRAWAAWTSNAEGGKYNIFVTTVSQTGEPCEPKRVSIGNDDSMHGRMACDKQGNIWVTYYKWQNIGNRSRDREVFVRRFSKGQWSRQAQISPTDVPNYEDHTEPAIACYEDGAIVCWSWDFHQPQGYTKRAYNPTIFVGRVSGELETTRPVIASEENTNLIDVTPGVSVIGQKMLCIWDSMDTKTNRKQVCSSQTELIGLKKTGNRVKNISGPAVNVCTPTIVAGKYGRVCVVWSETQDGDKWILKMSEFDAKSNQRLRSKIIESTGNPRFCSACYDNNGKLWVAYSVQKEGKREIVVKQN
jgi:peroxiredoxin